MTKARSSIAKVYQTIAFIMVPTLLLSMIFGSVVRNNMSRHVTDMFVSRMENALGEESAHMESVNTRLRSFLLNDDKVSGFTEKQTLSPSELLEISSYLSEISGFLDDRYHFILYNSVSGMLASPVTDRQTLTLQDIRNNLALLTDEESSTADNTRKWAVAEFDNGTRVLYKTYGKSGVYAVCYIELEEFYDALDVNAYSSVGEYLFPVEKGEFLDGEDTFAELTNHVDTMVTKDGQTLIRGDYQLRYWAMDNAEFDLITVVDDLGGYSGAVTVITVLMLVCILFFVIGIAMLFYIRRKLMKPLQQFVEDLSTGPDDGGKNFRMKFAEADQVQQLIEKANKQIQQLKIEVYEKELEQQEMELSFLQSQVHPHFYLNNMSVFYAMAQAGRYKEIQQLSMEIAEYFRFLLKDGTKLVDLTDELNHVRRYLNIYQIRYDNEVTYQVNCTDECMKAIVPPLILLTMVENSFKYARQAEQVLTITLNIEKIQIKTDVFLQMEILDNGPGFPEKVLDDIRGGIWVKGHDGYGIGLSNTIKRIHYFYPGDGNIWFSNREEGGARVLIRIPYSEDEEE